VRISLRKSFVLRESLWVRGDPGSLGGGLRGPLLGVGGLLCGRD
jgi:hypothetical protein